MYREYDEFIAGTEIFDDINKSLDKIQKELSELITDDIDKEKKRLLTWEGQLFICCEIPLEQRDEGQQFLFPQAVYTNGVKIPDIDNFEAERLDFYKHRFEMIINVPAKIRYANYCFQYCEKNQKYKYAMQICQLLCEHLKDVTFGHECIVSFSRLFELGLSFSNKDIIQKLDGIVDELISRDYTQEEYLYLLSISRIVAGNIAKNKNDFIKAETQEKFVSIIEEMSDYYFQRGDYSLYRNCCPNYMDWLKILKRQDEIDAVLLKIGESYVLDADKEGNSNLVKAEFYQLAAKHYANIGEREKVYHLKVKIKNAFKDAGSSGEFKTISTTQSVSVEQLEKETKDFQATGHKVINISNEMASMKVKDILEGLKFEVVSKKNFDEKVVIFSNFPDEELQMMVSIAKVITENPIMAVVTETSKEWQFNYLVEHLIEEREWYRSMQGGKA